MQGAVQRGERWGASERRRVKIGRKKKSAVFLHLLQSNFLAKGAFRQAPPSSTARPPGPQRAVRTSPPCRTLCLARFPEARPSRPRARRSAPGRKFTPKQPSLRAQRAARAIFRPAAPMPLRLIGVIANPRAPARAPTTYPPLAAAAAVSRSPSSPPSAGRPPTPTIKKTFVCRRL